MPVPPTQDIKPPELVVCTHALFPAMVCPLLALAKRGTRITVYCPRETTKPSYDHDFTLKIIEATPAIELKPLADFHIESQILWLGVSHWLAYPGELLAGILKKIPRSTRINLIYDSAYGNYGKRLAAQLRASVKWPRLLLASRIVHVGDPKAFDLFGIGPRRVNFLIPPSTDFFIERAAGFARFDSIHEPRTRRFCFTGANHHVRRKILAACNPIFTDQDSIAPSIRISSQAYLQQLKTHDFSLCLPGGLVWSHRIIESILCGCIPILGVKAYAFVKSVVPESAVMLVTDDHSTEAWFRAVKKAAAMTAHQIQSMRETLLSLSSEHGPLHGEAMISQMLKPFGIVPKLNQARCPPLKSPYC